jgi:predicted RNase H-like HicB family nuclease
VTWRAFQIIKPGEDRGFVAYVRALRGCWSEGMTREEALANVREAAEAWLEVEQDKVDRGNLLGQVELITL